MEEKVTGIYTAELFAIDAAGIVYKQMKAKIFDLLESQLAIPNPGNLNDPKLAACKRIAESMISATAKDVKSLIVDVLGDWEQEVEASVPLPSEEACKAARERAEIDNAIR